MIEPGLCPYCNGRYGLEFEKGCENKCPTILFIAEMLESAINQDEGELRENFKVSGKT